MELRLQAQTMLSHSSRTVYVLPSTGTSTSSTLRLLMSHGSQLALVPMANPATRTTGVHTTRTDHPSSRTTRAHTPPRKPQHLIWSGMATMDWGWMHWVRFLVFVIFRFSRQRASCSELVRYQGGTCIPKNTSCPSRLGDARVVTVIELS